MTAREQGPATGMGSGDGSSERPPARSKCLAPHSSTECVKHLSFTRDAESNHTIRIRPDYRALFRPSVSSRLRIATRTRARSPATTRRRRRGDTLESVALARCAARRGRLRAVVLDRGRSCFLGAHAHRPCTYTNTFGHVTQTSRSVALLPPCQSLSNRLLQTLDSACTV